MKQRIIIILIAILISSCKKQKVESFEFVPKTIAEKIAYAHGFANWKNVSEIKFTFNVDKDSIHFERKWKWNPSTHDVTMTNNIDTISFNRSKLDSLTTPLDRRFINDKYWLLVPFQLIWDEGITISDPTIELAPLSKTALNKITLTYSDEGGYTPGDAYDIFYNDKYIIQEWVFREGNSDEPSLITTFENYQDISDIKIAIEHKKIDENWNLNFTDISITLISQN